VWVDLVITNTTVGWHLNSYFAQPQSVGELTKGASLAATQEEELTAKHWQYAKAFLPMPAASFFGFGLDTYGAWSRRAEEFVDW
jgi:hypothetical protein